MLPCLSCYICGTWRSKEIPRGGQSYQRREGEKPQARGNFMGRHKKITQGGNH